MVEIGNDINKAAQLLENGGLVGIPTETVYGLAANAFDDEAVLKVFKAKDRPSFDPLITHIKNPEELDRLATHVPEKARILMDHFWPGPLTLVLPRSETVSDLITSGLPTAGFRMPRHQLTQELLSRLSFPVVAPSANPFGYISPTTPSHVAEQLSEKIDYVLNGGRCSIGIESTILGFENNQAHILRQGGVSKESLESCIGKLSPYNETNQIVSPGMFGSHYAPRKPLYLGNIDELLTQFSSKKVGVLYFKNVPEAGVNYSLAPHRTLDEAACRLFFGLRWLEKQDIDLILAEQVPNEGIGRAVNDRLMCASVNNTLSHENN